MEGWGLFSDKMAEAPAPQQFPGVLCSLGPGVLAHVLPRAPVSPTLPACLPAWPGDSSSPQALPVNPCQAASWPRNV